MHCRASCPAANSSGSRSRAQSCTSLIVCDEPTSALDHATGQSILALLRGIADDGRTLIVVTHDQRILSFADRIAYMDDGRITRIDKPGKAGAGDAR
jgi:putative ABC transport system ATP-binding protein